MFTPKSGSDPGGSLAGSPFIELGCPFTFYEALKMLLLLPLVPLRLVVGGLSLVAIATINSLVAWNWPPEKPLTPWRRRVVLLSKELVLLTLWCLGFRIRVRGRENVKTAERMGAVAVFNHVSWVDAFVLVWLLAPSGVSKESNGRIPVIGQAVRALQTVYIPYDKLSKRSKKDAASADGGVPAVTTTASTAADALTSAAAEATGCSADGVERSGSGGSECSSPSPNRTIRDSKRRVSGSSSSDNGSYQGYAHCSSNSSSDGGSASSSSGNTSRALSPGGSFTANGNAAGKEDDDLPACTTADITAASAGITACAAGKPATRDTDNDACEQAAATTRKAAGDAASPLPTSPPSVTRRSHVVLTNVTDVLLRRVNHPSYCQPGGFPMVAMAPEGTTANGRGLLNFRTGAFALRRPVLPICLRYRWRGLNPAWTIGDERWHFLRLMCQFRSDLEVEILPPYKPSQDELKEPRLFASHVRRLMAAVLDVPLVDASHDDYLALKRMGVQVSWDGRRATLSGNSC